MKSVATKTRYALGGMVLMLALALCAPLASAQGSAPTAGLIAGRPAFAAGATATFRGRGFEPGETVTFQITHARGTPVTGADHTPAQVVADPGGAFVATWQVCAADCAGELLRIEATGLASGKVGYAMFMDLPGPPAPGASAQAAAKGRAHLARAGAVHAASAPTFERIYSFGTAGPGAYLYPGLIQGTDGALYGATNSGGNFDSGVVYKVNPDGSGFAVLKSFEIGTGAYPFAGLLQGSDGALYGVTQSGGSSINSGGVVFKLNTDGSGYTVLKDFDYYTTGAVPASALMQGADGALYGTTSNGGAGGYGTLFKLNMDGSGFAVLAAFDNLTTGSFPRGRLTQGTDGALYGTAFYGASYGYGVAFKVNTDGSGFSVLHQFNGAGTGGYPFGGVIQGTDGALYGTTYLGGSNNSGTVFKLNTDGSGFAVIQNLQSAISAFPQAGLVQGTDGALYGTAQQGSGFYGTVFKLNTDGSGFAVLMSFDYSTQGANPYASLVQGTDGAVYGTAAFGGSGFVGTAFKVNTDGSGFTVLKSFSPTDMSADGGYIQAGLIQGTDGLLYGAAFQGGTSNSGTVFSLNTDGSGFSLLQSLDYYTTGGYPYAALVQGTDGILYGPAYQGGSGGGGTVFKLNTDGSGFAVLHDFDYYNGAYAQSALVQGADGTLYGTTTSGGSGSYGTVYKVNTDGSGFAVLHEFNGIDGASALGGVILGTDGVLYGTTQAGSGSSGNVFKLNTDGSGFAVLHDFDYSGGATPIGGLMQGPGGALYGTTIYGGSSGFGTVFKLNTDGSGFTVLHEFDYYTDVAYPYAGLVEGADGALYGTASGGGGSGANGAGAVFRVNPDGSGYSVVYGFDNGANGGYPYGRLVRGTDGNLYGTTYQGGDTGGAGTIFRLIFGETNQPPVAVCKDVTVSSGVGCVAAASIDDGSSDPDAGDTITLAQSPAGPYALGATSVTLTVTDNNGASSSCSATVTVTNAAPVATITGPASGSFYAVNTPVSFTGTWTDANGGPHTAQWTFDGSPDASFSAGTGVSGAANTSHTFAAAGVYMVSLAVTDNCGATGTANQVGGVDEMVVIYDPNAGFVTGGGWINSPAGAYVPNPSLTGKANFGFVSKYKKGATIPTGETEFQYKVGNLNFHSTSYDWLVVAGAKAQYKGTGTINNAGTYKFMLTAIDGQIAGGGGQDKFRMKITETGGGLVYDNLLNAPDSDDPTTLLGGGSIVIHTGGNSMSAGAGETRQESELRPTEYALAQNYPNPFDRSTLVAFSLPERSRISLVVYDLVGREVRRLADGEWEPGRHSATMTRTSSDGSTLSAGVYFVRMNARSLTSERSFSSLRKMLLVK